MLVHLQAAFLFIKKTVFCINHMGSLKFNILTMMQQQKPLTISGGIQNNVLFE
jgi:hypothetical protein